MTNSATPTPRKVTKENHGRDEAVSMSDSNWSTSVVIRVMIRPVISCS